MDEIKVTFNNIGGGRVNAVISTSDGRGYLNQKSLVVSSWGKLFIELSAAGLKLSKPINFSARDPISDATTKA